MKKLLFTALASSLSLCGYAQTKGTSTLGFGVNVTTFKSEYSSLPENKTENKLRFYSLGYGLFIEDNTRIGLDLNYGSSKYDTGLNLHQENKNYGGNFTYQRYYPLIKTLYAYAGGLAGYSYYKQENNDINQPVASLSSNRYALGAYGGLTWFVSKRFAFETNLLSANISYSSEKQDNPTFTSGFKSKQTSFNMTTQGFIDDLGFKIYLLF